MNATERRRQISSLTALQGRVSVNELASRFRVTAETIRRDLAVLDAEGKLYRVHGGAVAVRNFRSESTSYEDRAKSSLHAKRVIGQAALQFIPPDGGTIFMDAGTTTGMMAEALVQASTEAQANHGWSHRLPHVRVITTSLTVARQLAVTEFCEVQMIGGLVRPHSHAVVGDVATRSLAVLSADVAFLGTTAMTLEHGLSTPDASEASIKRAMIAGASEVVALCDSTKFGVDYVVSFASVQEITTLITDSDAPQQMLEPLRKNNVNVILAPL